MATQTFVAAFSDFDYAAAAPKYSVSIKSLGGQRFSVTGQASDIELLAREFELLPAPQDGDLINPLISEYAAWNKAQGLALGSADEHLFDDVLTAEQRAWLADFCRRWQAAADAERGS